MRAIFALTLLTGCSHSAVVVGNAQPVAPASGVHVNATGAVGAVVLIGVAATAAIVSDPQPMPSSSMFSDWSSQPAPAMAADRDVNLQDCTQPLDLGGNLRCR